MFKKLILSGLVAILAAASGAGAVSALAAPAASVQSLTADETAGLLYMYQEEKLARDVYEALYALWGQPAFQSIAASEQIHMDAIQALLVQYGLPVPASAAGSFTDPALQALYNDLLGTGSLSLVEALRVGATIEEVDITDLQTRLAQTTNADIQLVYNNLMHGSYNHLRSFVNVLERQGGGTYQPQYLDAGLYQSILADSNGQGYGGGTGAGVRPAGGRGHRGGR